MSQVITTTEPTSTARVAALRTAAMQGGRVLDVAPDGLIFAEGDNAEHWYEVVSGAVRVCKLTSDGRRQIIDIVLPGEVFGFDGWGQHATSAEAASTDGAVVRRRCRRRLEALADDDAEVARQVRQFTSRGLARAHERLLMLGRCTAAERVAMFLLEMQERLAGSATHGAGTVTLPMARTEIGDYLGLTMETVSRTIGAFAKAGTITLLSCHLLHIRDRRALLALAGRDGSEARGVAALGSLRMALLPEAA
jgi:CRP/FNR family nitrogen fixation transcriptional regulator